jgi:hypothetical protein
MLFYMAGAGIQSLAKSRAQMCAADCGHSRRLERALQSAVHLRAVCLEVIPVFGQSAAFDRGT